MFGRTLKIPIRSKKVWLTGVTGLTIAGLMAAWVTFAGPASAAPITVEVRSCGATGNGTTNDTGAINTCITRANAAGPDGGIVHFPSGTYRSANSIHMKSNVTLQLDSGATIRGAGGSGYDAPESNPNSAFQDFGHSHFHDAMIWGDRLTNIGFVGPGVIDGGGNLITGNPSSGQADKIISLTRCNGLRIGDGITLRRGGHFAALINGCTNVTSDRLTIDTASDRDGWNVISTTNVKITNANIAANDDALAFKSDYALGAKLPNGTVEVANSRLSARCCNALMFGSETCGDFTGYNFHDITITGANKSGLGLVSMDGAIVSDVHYRDITVTGVSSPIMLKIGTRRRCGNSPGVGFIRNITYDNINITGKSSPQYTATIWGASSTNRVSNVTFNNVNITVPGGHDAMGTGVPSNDPNNYNPNSIGTRPSYGWYIHNASGITFNNSSVRFQSSDARPAVIANAGSTVRFNGFTAQRGSGSPFDMGFQNISGFCVQNSQNTSGGALRISNSGSTMSCVTTPPPGRFEAENATLSPGSTVDSDHAGFSGTGFVNTPNVVGCFVEWTGVTATAGTRTVSFRFANGSTAARPMDIVVNGAAPVSLNFPPTGSWETWSTASIMVPLNATGNTIRATATTAGGAPNLDFLEVSNA